jgi:hypothetical protein
MEIRPRIHLLFKTIGLLLLRILPVPWVRAPQVYSHCNNYILTSPLVVEFCCFNILNFEGWNVLICVYTMNLGRNIADL